jgi:hypothetical protein
MEPKDVAGCTEIIATHPVIGPRYGARIEELGRAWRRLLGSEAMTTAVFEEIESGCTHLAGVGVGVFVRDEFIRELKTPPLVWFGFSPNAFLTGIRSVIGQRSPRGVFRRWPK